MKHASLFSGIGGFDLAASWLGWENVFHCEIDPFCRQLLQYYWPKAKSYEDIKTLDATQFRGGVDVLSGGFPCQPFSVAGKRRGTHDERYLWPEMFRLTQQIQPRYLVAENVPGLLNWSKGLVFEQVCTDLETAGYEVWPFVLPAAGFNAPHRRDRIWFIAHAQSDHLPGFATAMGKKEGDGTQRKGTGRPLAAHKGADAAGRQDVSNAHRKRLAGPTGQGLQGQARRPEWCDPVPSWDHWPTQHPVRSGDDGFCPQLDGITFPRWRKETLKAFGNAIVPQVAHAIFSVIAQLENSVNF